MHLKYKALYLDAISKTGLPFFCLYPLESLGGSRVSTLLQKLQTLNVIVLNKDFHLLIVVLRL